MAKSPQQSDASLLTGLAQKVAHLEARLAALEKRVAASRDDEDLEGFIPDRYGYLANDASDPVKPEPITVKRGRRPRIPPSELTRRRDDLIRFIEPRWPDLVPHLKKHKSIESLLKAIKNASPGAQANWPYQHLARHIVALQKFLQSGRYKGEPRQIAYALAGLPEIAWRSSLDHCTKNPSALHIILPAFLDHIRRHRPKCHDSLLKDGVTPENLRMLRGCCAECRRLAAKPEQVAGALQHGRPLIHEQR